jgi:hypothetical protein
MEFLVKTPVPASTIIEEAEKEVFLLVLILLAFQSASKGF